MIGVEIIPDGTAMHDGFDIRASCCCRMNEWNGYGTTLFAGVEVLPGAAAQHVVAAKPGSAEPVAAGAAVPGSAGCVRDSVPSAAAVPDVAAPDSVGRAGGSVPNAAAVPPGSAEPVGGSAPNAVAAPRAVVPAVAGRVDAFPARAHLAGSVVRLAWLVALHALRLPAAAEPGGLGVAVPVPAGARRGEKIVRLVAARVALDSLDVFPLRGRDVPARWSGRQLQRLPPAPALPRL